MSKFVTNVLKLVSGSVLSQIVGVLLLPVITRLYTPTDFGVFQIFLSMTGIIAILATFSYQMAIMLPEKDEDAVNVLSLTLLLSGAVSLVSGTVCIIYGESIAVGLKVPTLADYFIYVPLVIFLSSAFMAIQYWLSRKVRFGATATSRVANSITTRGSQVLLGLRSASASGLIYGVTLGYIVGNLFMIKGIWQDRGLLKHISKQKMRELGYRYRDFPKFSLLGQITNEFSTQLTSFVLVFYFSSAVVGYYSLGNQIIAIPTGLVGAATAQVFFQKANEERIKNGSVANVVRSVHKRLISLGMFPTILLVIMAEDVFVLFFGSTWYTAGIYAKILAPWHLLVFIMIPLVTLFSVLEKQKIGLLFNLTLFGSRVVVLIIGGLIGDPLIALMLYSVTGIIFWGWLDFYLLKIADVGYRESLDEIARYLVLGVAVGLPVIAVKMLSLPVVVLLGTAAAMTCVYYGIVILKDSTLQDMIRGTLNQFGLLGRSR
jgi:O-antigen/teichoic acid export membrane protein